MANGPNIQAIGSSAASHSPIAVGAHNFRRNYFYHKGTSGDVRATYEDLYFDSTGSGETLRLRGIANGTGVATGGTVNALHATGRVAAGKTVSGALNGIRATLEVAGTTPTPGGTLAAIQSDSNIVTGATMGAHDAHIRFTESGATDLPNVFYFPEATDNVVIANGTYSTAQGYLVIDVAGTKRRIAFYDGAD